MKRYEFICLCDPVMEMLNGMGRDGWTVASAAWYRTGGLQSVLFQREIVETSTVTYTRNVAEPAKEKEKRK